MLRSQSYTYDAGSQVTAHTVGSVTTSYGYDAFGQLTPKAKIKPKAKLKVGCGAAVYTELGAKYMSPTINIAPVIRFYRVLRVLAL
jgi:hypothetical protein